jgi:hypothetical protein
LAIPSNLQQNYAKRTVMLGLPPLRHEGIKPYLKATSSRTTRGAHNTMVMIGVFTGKSKVEQAAKGPDQVEKDRLLLKNESCMNSEPHGTHDGP